MNEKGQLKTALATLFEQAENTPPELRALYVSLLSLNDDILHYSQFSKKNKNGTHSKNHVVVKLEGERAEILKAISALKKADHKNSLELMASNEKHRSAQQEHEAAEAQAQRDHEEKLAIIAHETARENRLAAEAAAKVAATAQEQASQSIDGLLKGLQGNGEG